MGEQGGPPSGGMTEHLNALLCPPPTGPAPIQDLSSVLRDPVQHVHIDIDQAPEAIAAFRQAADQLRDLMVVAGRLAEFGAPAEDAVSVSASQEIGRWAVTEEPGSLRWALQSGAIELEKVADALERSVVAHQNADEASSAHLNRLKL